MGSRYSLTKITTMRGLTVMSLAVLAVAVMSTFINHDEGPVYDSFTRVHCPYLFPNTKTLAAGRLNETIFHLEGQYFNIRAEIAAALDKVVSAQTDACIEIGKIIANAANTTMAPSK